MLWSFYVILAIYLAISIPIFVQVYHASELVIDEEFHLRQGRYYCQGDFLIVSVVTYFSSAAQKTLHRNFFSSFLFSFLTVGSKNNNIPWIVYNIRNIFIAT